MGDINCDRLTIDLMLRMLAAGVGLRTLAEFSRGAFRDKRRSPIVSDELCEAVVVLNGCRVCDEDMERFRQLAIASTSAANIATLHCFTEWLKIQQCSIQSLKQLCRTGIRKRLAAANGHTDMTLLVDKLLPNCPGLNKYLKYAARLLC